MKTPIGSKVNIFFLISLFFCFVCVWEPCIRRQSINRLKAKVVSGKSNHRSQMSPAAGGRAGKCVSSFHNKRTRVSGSGTTWQRPQETDELFWFSVQFIAFFISTRVTMNRWKGIYIFIASVPLQSTMCSSSVVVKVVVRNFLNIWNWSTRFWIWLMLQSVDLDLSGPAC